MEEKEVGTEEETGVWKHRDTCEIRVLTREEERPGEFQLGVSTLGGGDVLGTPEPAEVVTQVTITVLHGATDGVTFRVIKDGKEVILKL